MRRGLTAAVAAWALSGCSPGGDLPPNVVLISIDTLRHDFLGFAGAPEGTSPHVDRLARRGTVFSNALSTTSWTLPSHLSLFTGQYPPSHGVVNDGRALPEDKETLAEYLGARGYATAGFWAGPYLHPAYGIAQGFDVWQECVNYRIRLTDEGMVRNTGFVNAFAQSGVTGPRTDAAAGSWLEGAADEGPWFLFAHYWDPHADYEPPPPYDRFLDDGYTGRITGHGLQKDGNVHAGMPEEDRKRLMDLYRGEVRWTDAWIGRILRRLEERGETDRTLLIVTADHGEEFFEHGLHGHRFNLYDESLRVPLVVRYPERFDGGGIVRSPVSLVDVFPTVAAIVGDGDPGRSQGLDLADAGERPARGVYAELHGTLEVYRDPLWKAVRGRASGEGELYSLRDDPGETHDVRTEHEDVWELLERKLVEEDVARWAPDDFETPVLDPETEAELRALGYTD